ncbi:MAG TPA: phospholipase D-like domain-containing protein [Bryobacteraceae bacterium]
METFFLTLAVTGIAIQLLIVILALFEPGLAYRIEDPPDLPLDSDEFARVLSVLSDAETHRDTHVEVLTNGGAFYEAELAAIAGASSHICLEAYIFQKGEIASKFIHALTERARAGVRVRVVLDAIGSFNTWRRTFRDLIHAGGEVHWYMPFRWYNLPRLNNRTHRELLIVDGRVGFIGGAGVADHWYKAKSKRRARWRDTMFRVEGRAVSSLQSMFAENWLESSDELLTGRRYYPKCRVEGSVTAMVINSAPSYGRATRARMLFQTLIATARQSIHITTPYFLPDRSARQELVRAIRRGVELKIVVPGKHSDHLLTRRSSRRLYGELLEQGAQIYEYQPSMIHTKSMVLDGVWSVVGSTNFDHRSFGLNDEVNLAAMDEGLATRLERDFQRDLADSRRITLAEWRRRSPFERVNEWLGWILERQE